MSNNIQVQDWREKSQALAAVLNGEVLIRDISDDKIKRINIDLLNGAVDTVEQWVSTTTYSDGDIVAYNSLLWESQQDNNLNNAPVEGSYWSKVNKSTANGFGRYAVGVYTIDPTMVINGDSLYVLSESVTLPFNSTDFAVELLNGDWTSVVGDDDSLIIGNPELKTPSGVPTNQGGANQEFTSNIKAILDEISRLASASASIIANPVPITITTTDTQLDFDADAESTDTSILDVDEINNELDLFKAGRYTYTTSLEIENSSNNIDHSVTVRTRDASNDTLLTSRIVDIPAKTTRTDFRAVFYDLEEGDEPQAIYISLEGSSNTSLTLNKFETTLSVAGVVGSSSDVNVKVSDNDTTTGKLSIKQQVGEEFENEIINPSGNEYLLLKSKGWIYNSLRDFKHILLSNADADYTQTLQNKSGTVALIDDIDLPQQEGNLAVVSNNIDIDFNSKKNFVALNSVIVSNNTTITVINESNARFFTFDVTINNNSILTFNAPVSWSIISDFGGNIFTEGNGTYTISAKFNPTNSEIRIVTTSDLT